MPAFDLSKYGFVLKSENDGHFLYSFHNQGREVELSVRGNIFSISVLFDDTALKVASRYKIETQEQLDFLIFNGRVGALFIPLSCKNVAL